MTLHVLFNENGIPGWIGDAPRAGSEPVEGVTIEFLARHRRTARGKWVARTPVLPAALPAEDLARQREAEHQSALVLRSEALRLALAAEADPIFFRWQRGEAAQEDWLEAVVRVKARFPKPERS